MDNATGRSGIAVRARYCRGLLNVGLLSLLSVVLAGCLQLERIVQVNGDGSGILIERLVMSNEFVGMMQSMQSEGEPAKIRDDEKLRRNAAKFGPSVRFLSATDLVTDFGRGYEARYAFDDINTLRIGEKVDDSVSGDSAGSDHPPTEESSFTSFRFRRTDPAQLVIRWSGDGDGDGRESEDPAEDYSDATGTPEQQQLAMEMVKMAFKDMRVAMHVEVAGEILETNAMYIEGRRVTLMDINFTHILANEQALEAMAGKKPETVADMKDLMKLVPGLKMEIEPEVSIVFR